MVINRPAFATSWPRPSTSNLLLIHKTVKESPASRPRAASQPSMPPRSGFDQHGLLSSTVFHMGSLPCSRIVKLPFHLIKTGKSFESFQKLTQILFTKKGCMHFSWSRNMSYDVLSTGPKTKVENMCGQMWNVTTTCNHWMGVRSGAATRGPHGSPQPNREHAETQASPREPPQLDLYMQIFSEQATTPGFGGATGGIKASDFYIRRKSTKKRGALRSR